MSSCSPSPASGSGAPVAGLLVPEGPPLELGTRLGDMGHERGGSAGIDKASVRLSLSSAPVIEEVGVGAELGSSVREGRAGACDEEVLEDICCDRVSVVSGSSALAPAVPQLDEQDALDFECLLSEALHVAAREVVPPFRCQIGTAQNPKQTLCV